jgi:hypothetical protein
LWYGGRNGPAAPRHSYSAWQARPPVILNNSFPHACNNMPMLMICQETNMSKDTNSFRLREAPGISGVVPRHFQWNAKIRSRRAAFLVHP